MPEIRSLTLKEIVAYNKLSSICFGISLTTEDLNPMDISPEKLRQYCGCFDDDGTLLGGMILLEMDCRFEGNTCRFIGVGGVVTDPAERRRGAIRQLFEHNLSRLRDEGFVLSALYPFSHEFYRKFGYELCIIKHTMKFSADNLRKDLYRAATIRRILPDESDGGMKQVYDQYMLDKNLGILRSEEQWKALRSGTPWENQKHSYVLYNGANVPIAYWIGTMSKDEGDTLLAIDDLAYVGREGMESIFTMLCSMNEVSMIKLVTPQDMPLRYMMADPYDVDEETTCGGSLEKRMNFPIEVSREIFRVVKEYAPKNFIVGYRISPEEIHGENVGYTWHEAQHLVAKLTEMFEFDYIHLSTLDYKGMPEQKDSDKTIAELMGEAIKAPTLEVVTGGITTYEQMLDCLNYADIVGLGRMTLMDCQIGYKIEHGLQDQLKTFFTEEGLREGHVTIGTIETLAGIVKSLGIDTPGSDVLLKLAGENLDSSVIHT